MSLRIGSFIGGIVFAFYVFSSLALCAPIVDNHNAALLSAHPSSDSDAVNGVYVHLFEWTWESIANECETFLGPKGYRGVQISPPNEHRRVTEPFLPWWQRYQPVSYTLVSRSGDRAQFINMVERCAKAGIEIYADIVFNHMTGGGYGYGYAGNYFNADTLSFPEYSAFDFHSCVGCPSNCEINDYQNRTQVQWCRLAGLRDLRTEDTTYVVPRIVAYMNDLIDIGVAGFRLDAAKHTPAHDLVVIQSMLHDRKDGKGRPFVYQEVIDLGNEPITNSEYTSTGRVTEFKYGMELGKCFRNVDNYNVAMLKNFGEEWNFLASKDAMAFTDNHDNQRGHGAGGYAFLVTHDMPREYTLANIYMLSWDYGYVQVMSSYNWTRNFTPDGKVDLNDWIGPPAYEDGTTKPADCSTGEWICEHRWHAIANMVSFRASAVGEPTQNWWDNGVDKIAFSRGNKAFVAISSSQGFFERVYQTGLPAGQYCDIINGDLGADNKCTGRVIQVNENGMATIKYGSTEEEVTAAAIHFGAKPSLQ
eukprot:TRINITY_DN4700_c0_g1_i1.p1 TRINITY_DN4700_c0_g1~~TRINITY_DN4700_c0_g1_i1.p1  ORF type:complete len:532 (-),score=101.66 TRINITY_DN4700_c0_g1_i1:282-1877(-)